MLDNRYTNIKVGLVASIGFIVLILLFTWKSGSALRFSGYEVVGQFQNVGGLLEESDVRYRGYNVGRVIQILPEPKSISVYVKIKKTIVIPVDSKFRIAFDGLIGQKYLEVLPGNSPESLPPGGVIPGYSAAGIVDFIDEGAKSMQEVQRVLVNVRQFLETQELQKHVINSVRNLEEVTDQLKRFTPQMSKALNELNGLIGNINTVVADPENQENFKATMSNSRELSDKLKKILNDINDLTEKKENKENIEKIIKNLKDITDQLSGDEGGSGGITSSLQSLKNFTEMKLGVNAALLAVPEKKLATGRAGFDLVFSEKKAYHFKLKEDIETKEIARFSITGENAINDQWNYHYGIIDSQLGAGFSYDFTERIRLISEIYQPSALKANIQAQYAIDPNWQLITAAEKINKDGSDVYVGLGYKK